MAHEKIIPKYSFNDDKIYALKKIVPEAFEDGRINFETLRESLGEYIEEDDNERFGLIWPGEKEARKLASISSKGTLVPIIGEGLNEDGTADKDGKNNSKNVTIQQ